MTDAKDVRRRRIAELNAFLGNRALVWFGIRGHDATPLLALDSFRASFAVTAKVGSASLGARRDVTLEELSGIRVDLDAYDLDFDASEAADHFRSEMLASLSTDCVLITYRPSAFTSGLAFSMEDTLDLAGMYKDRQWSFEHKPWVETQLTRRGVPTLGWTYVADSRRSIASRALLDGPIVLRTNRDSGGVGITLIETDDELEANWPTQSDHFAGIAPYIADAIPVNLSGCVFADGSISCHPPSVQLIGVASVTTRRFGYCGNDFGAIKELSPRALDGLQQLLTSVGEWLSDECYIGAFGVDALVRGNDVIFTEVNARMQGSTWLSSQIAQRLDLPDLVLDHLAASLSLSRGYLSPSVREWASMQPYVSHLVVHNTADVPVTSDGADPVIIGAEHWAVDPGRLQVAPGGVLGRLVWPEQITKDGFTISVEARAAVSLRCSSFRPTGERGSVRDNRGV